MSVYNEKQNWLRESIESIVNQTYKNIEFIIVIDNPQREDLIKIIKEYAKKDKRIKYFINEKNMGLVYSLNRALEYCNGEFIARIDADDISHFNRFEKQLEYLKKNNLDLIGSNVNLFNENGTFYTTNKLLTHKYIKKLLSFGAIGIVHPTFFGRKEVFKKLNGYKNAFHVEDKEFLARVICNGFKVGNIKDVLLDYRYNNQSITKTNAIYTFYIGNYITNVFKKCLKTGNYEFNDNYLKDLNITPEKKIKFNKRQILMGEAREKLKEKKYLMFVYKLVKALFYESKSTFDSIRINLLFLILRKLEQIEFGE
jgi:glycosyltransferase involved in cell wall biosynthesis